MASHAWLPTRRRVRRLARAQACLRTPARVLVRVGASAVLCGRGRVCGRAWAAQSHSPGRAHGCKSQLSGSE
eukprot:6181326-Pleurochrysis_carterae.AAC.1